MLGTSELMTRRVYGRLAALDELLSRDGSDFVRAAYHLILGREPDPQGADYYARRLAVGFTKLDVLSDICSSPESKRRRSGTQELATTLRRHRRRSFVPRQVRQLRRSREGDLPHELFEISEGAGGHYDPGVDVTARSLVLQANDEGTAIAETQGRMIEALAAEVVMLRAEVDEMRNARNVADQARDAMVAEVAMLRGIVDGLGHAIRGLTDAQLRTMWTTAAFHQSTRSQSLAAN